MSLKTHRFFILILIQRARACVENRLKVYNHKMNGSNYISYDEYMTLNPQAEDKKHTLSWKIKDDKLILSTYYQKQIIETEYYRISQ